MWWGGGEVENLLLFARRLSADMKIERVQQPPTIQIREQVNQTFHQK